MEGMKCKTCASQTCSLFSSPSTRPVPVPNSPNKPGPSNWFQSPDRLGSSKREGVDRKEESVDRKGKGVDRKGKGVDREIRKSSPVSSMTGKRKREETTEVNFNLLDQLVSKHKESEGGTRAYLLHRLRRVCDELGVDMESVVDL